MTKAAAKISPQASETPSKSRVCASTDLPPHLMGNGAIRHPSRVEPAEWRDPADNAAMARDSDGRRGRKVVSGYRTSDPLDRLPCDIEHLKAARRLRQDWERGSGAMSGSGDAGKVDNSRDPTYPVQSQLDARRSYQSAVSAVGPRLCAYLLPVVLSGWTVADIVEKRDDKPNPMAVQGRVMAALDRLVDHFFGHKHTASAFPLPEPGPAVVDASVRDIPQERLGRASV